MSNEIILEGRGLGKDFELSDSSLFTAVRCVDIKLKKGQTLAVIGESGSGKTTLARMLVGLEKASRGQVLYKNQPVDTLKGQAYRDYRRNVQMVFQDPVASLNPQMKVKEILLDNLRNFEKITSPDQLASDLLEMVELDSSFLNRYPHEMSGGQRQRVCIARALSLEPGVLVCDEVTSALDMSVQDKIVRLLVTLQEETGVGMAFISHDIALAQAISHQIMVMYQGEVVEFLPSSNLEKNAQHPYTRLLLNSIVPLKKDQQTDFIYQEASNLGNVPASQLNLSKEELANQSQYVQIAKDHYIMVDY